MKKLPCRLCAALSGTASSDGVRRCDTILYKTENFVLMPAIGPMILGHAMIVSRKHAISLADMSSDVLDEYNSLIQMLLNLPLISNNLLEAEHGGTTDDSGGGCIAHTHVNVFPGLASLASIFVGRLPRMAEVTSMQDICKITGPYILIRESGYNVQIFSSQGLPSQFIRRILSNELQLDRWDWRTAPEYDLIEQTITLWEAAFSNEKNA